MRRLTVVLLLLASLVATSHANSAPITRTIFWANVQGASHTGRASAITRMATMAAIIERRHADLGVLVECERSQRRAFLADTGGVFALVHNGPNAVFWRKSVYRLVTHASLVVPYFGGHRWRIPIVRVQDRATHRFVRLIGVHNTASTARHPHQGRWRALDEALEVRYINRHPGAHIIIAGDWNTKRPGIAVHTRLRRSAGLLRIDAAFAVPERTLSSYRRIPTRATDHRAVYLAHI
jgi:hypothetical protein